MKKFFYLFAASLVAFSFASCEPNKPSRPSDDDDPKPKKLKFQLDVNIESPTKATWTVTPSDTTAWYWVEYGSLDWVIGQITSSIDELPEARIKALKEAGFDFDFLLIVNPPVAHKGKWTYTNDKLNPNEEYVLFAFPIDEDLNVKGDIVYQSFTTIPKGYVDLGLPSGTLWKEWNESNLWNYYEDVINEFGDAVPSLTQWEELINNCTWTYDEYNNAFVIEGANGKTINMYCGGYRDCSGTGTLYSQEGWYWTSTSTGDATAYAAFFKHYDTYDNITTDEMPKCNGFSVHLIYPER